MKRSNPQAASQGVFPAKQPASYINNSQRCGQNGTDTISATIALRKIYKIKLPDAVIAATSLAHGLSLITRDEADFKKNLHLALINRPAHTFHAAGHSTLVILR